MANSLVIQIGANISGASRAVGQLEGQIRGLGATMNTANLASTSAAGGIGGSLAPALGAATVAAEKHTSALTAMGKALGAVALAGFGVHLIADAFGNFLNDAIESQKVTTQLNAVLLSTKGVAGVTAASVNALSDSLSRVTAYDDEAITSAQSMLLTFTQIGRSVMPVATEAVLNMSTALGQDLQSSAIQLGKALQDPVAGVTALQRVGVRLTDSQKDLVGSLVATGDVMGAQKVILSELETEFGGAAKAAGTTFAGQLAILNTQVGNLKEEMGTPLIGVLSGLVTSINAHVIPGIHAAATTANRDAETIARSIDTIKRAQAGLGNNATISPAVRSHSDSIAEPIIASVERFARATALAGLQSNGLVNSYIRTVQVAELFNRVTADGRPIIAGFTDGLGHAAEYTNGFDLALMRLAPTITGFTSGLGHAADVLAAYGQTVLDQTALIAAAYAKQKQAAIDAQVASDALNHPVTLGHAADQIQAASDAMGGTTNTLTQNSDAFAAATQRSDAYAASLKKTGSAGAAAFRPFGAAIDAIDKRIARIQLGALEKAYARISQRPLDPNRPTQELGRLDLQRRILGLKQTLATPYGGFGSSSSSTAGAAVPYALPPVRSSQAPNTINNTVTVHTGPITGAGDEDRLADKVLDALLQGGKTANTASKQLPGA